MVRSTASGQQLLFIVAALSAAAVAVQLVSAGRAQSPPAPKRPAAVAPRSVPARPRAADVRRPSRRSEPGSLVVHVKPGSAVAVRSKPFGRVLARVGAYTEFGSPSALPVVRSHSGRWLAVPTTLLPNGRLGWIDASAGRVSFSRSRLMLEVDLSRRELLVRTGDRIVRALRVAVGRSGSPTPTGRFAVTDKLPGRRYSSAYGCCILALSGHQTRLPAGWSGGSRLAIHGTSSPADIGGAVSAGCLHASARDLAYLMRRVPLGSPVVIHV